MTSPSRAQSFRCEGIVLRHRDAGEADRFITLLTPDRGLVRAVARGARKTTSKIGGHLDLLRHVSLTVSEGHTFRAVGQVEGIESYRGLREDLGRMSRGIYMAELAERFSVEDAPNPSVFRLLASALGLIEKTWDGTSARPVPAQGVILSEAKNLAQSSDLATRPATDSPTLDLLARWFEIRILHLSGFLPRFSSCAECGRDLEQRDHVFSAERGGLLCPDCKTAGGGERLLPAGVPAIKLLRHMARSDWPAVEGLRVPPDDLAQAERILRTHLRHVIDHKINSAAFMDEVRKWRNGGRRPPLPEDEVSG
ncbi:MAG: DNA repair protein RecO [Dehalococcoidia bacterium]|nr:DNA repair protein RecO [Dehalococcoidia bacterium]MSQ34990.1 DNA repair protein RecO [Dehalococcoidia bacterium]